MFVNRFLAPTVLRFVFAAIAVVAPATSIGVSAAPAAQVPSCVVGNWRAVEFAASMRQLLGDVPGVEVLSGDVLMQVQPSGSYEVRFTQVTMSMPTPAGPGTVLMDMTGTGMLREASPGMLASSGDRFAGSMTVTFGDETMTQDVDEDTTEGAPSPYECSTTRLVMTMDLSSDERVPFPFQRQ